jgi:hypothetical protein
MKLSSSHIHKCVDRICKSANAFHSNFVRIAPLGPELYFHLRSLDCLKAMIKGSSLRPHADLLYSMLTAWGMNSRKARLEPFEVFLESLQITHPLILSLQRVTLLKADPHDWDKLHTLWKTLRVTDCTSKYQMIGKSKVLAHLLPHWVAPIDRAHTLQFLAKSPSMPTLEEDQWQIFREIHEKFFLLVARKRGQMLSCWVDSASAYGWDSSIPKTIDNLIWGQFQKKKQPRRKKK